MSKSLILVGIVLVVLIGLASGYLLLGSRLGTSGPSLSSITNLKEQLKGDLTYTDESGFSFSYPKSVKVSDTTPDDDTYYTVLTLSKDGSQMTVTAKDTKAKTPDEWIKSDSRYQGASLAGATNMGGISAKQYSLGGKLITAGVDAAVVYLIEGPKDGGFWEDTQGVVASSFAFAGTKTSSSGDNAIYEEEEVVQ